MGDREQDAVRQAVEPRIARWAAWSCQDGTGRGLVSQLGRTIRSEPDYQSICLVSTSDDEAMNTEATINRLPAPERQILIAEWLGRGTVKQKSKDCHCSPPTYYKRLNRAYERIYREWFS